ncbi:MAG: hypothetical protein MUE96_09150 [Bacteroidia bacterium]|jgi:hypothetical protein|nr:hypothetical protein [Bacteroidia bacterium]
MMMDTALNLRDLPRLNSTQLAGVQFAITEVYTRPEDMRVRIVALDKAVILGRDPNIQTLLAVNTTQGMIAIESRVLALNMEGVVIESNVFIPMHAIYSVNLE